MLFIDLGPLASRPIVRAGTFPELLTEDTELVAHFTLFLARPNAEVHVIVDIVANFFQSALVAITASDKLQLKNAQVAAR